MHFSIPLEKAAIQYNCDDSVDVYLLFWVGGAPLSDSWCCYGLQFVFVDLPGHTHLLFRKKD